MCWRLIAALTLDICRGQLGQALSESQQLGAQLVAEREHAKALAAYWARYTGQKKD